MASHSSREPTPPPSWSDRRDEYVDDRKHRWQGAGDAARATRVAAVKRSSGRRVFVMLLLLLALFGLFVYVLLFSPAKTPLIVISATDYAWPVPPNAWVREDIAGLEELDGRTLHVVDTSTAWRSKSTGLAELDRRLRELGHARGNDGSILFYVALHGLVDEKGMPCLLLPGASPLNSAQWLPCDELLRHLGSELPAEVNKVLILDCTRIRTNWNLGLVRNTFVERLEELVGRGDVPNLQVLTSSGLDETSWASADLRGSAFGRAVRLGLAGAADRSERGEKIGNRNGRVSIAELHRYVGSYVERWAKKNRGVEQTPRLLLNEKTPLTDFRLTWSLDRSGLKRMLESEETAGRAADTIPLDDVAELWRKLDALRAARAYQADPLAWRELEQRLLQLEQLASAGEAYREPAERLNAELRERLTISVARATQTAAGENGMAKAALLAPTDNDVAANFKLHSLPLCEYFGTLDAGTIASTRGRLDLATAANDPESLEAIWLKSTRPEQVRELAEVQFIKLARRYEASTLWKQGDSVRKGLQLYELAERTAIFGDARAHYWLRPTLEAADAARRAAEDRYYLGPRKAAETAPWDAPLALYEAIGAANSGLRPRIETALLAYDRTCSAAPYLAEWYSRPGLKLTKRIEVESEKSNDGTKVNKPATPSPDDPVNGRLAPLFRNAKKLGELLDERSATPSTDAPPFLESARIVGEELEALDRDFRNTVEERLNESGSDGATLRELQAALDVPLLPADKRAAVMKKANELAVRLHAAGLEDAAPAAKPADKPASDLVAIGFAERISGWPTHPLAMILDFDEPSKTPEAAGTKPADPPAGDVNEKHAAAERVERLGTLARERLRLLPTLPLADDAAVGDAPRVAYARTARALRSAAPIWFTMPTVDPIARLRRFDMQQLLLWDCRRTLDDFWGSGGDKPGAIERSKPFFDTAASDHLAAARELLPPTSAVDKEFDALRRLLNLRRLASRRGAVAAVETGLPDGAGDSITLTVDIEPGDDSAQAAVQGAFPAGEGAAFARNAETILPLVREPWKTPLAGKGAELRLAGSVPETFGSAFQAVAMFRGNEYTVPFMRPGLGGVVVDFVPTLPDTAQVTLFGDRPQQSSVVFILDCSASMATDMPVELIDAQKLPRLEIAKSVLESLLEQLAIRGDTRVGVRFFGHRAGWAKEQLSKMLTQNDYAGSIPDDVSPSSDVELVLPLGRFSSVEAGLVTSRLKSVKPWGQSPLFLSLQDALRDFDADKGDTDKSIVVITDGANYQFTPAGGGVAAPAHRTLNDVATSWQGKNVPIYILGFGTAQAGDAAAEREFTELARRTQGRYFPIGNGRDLLTTLRERLGLGSYEVDPSGAAALGNQAATKLNSPVTVSGLRKQPADYTVRFEATSRQVLLEGGEALQLYASRGGEISARAYDQGVPVEDLLVNDNERLRLTVRAHRPRRIAAGVEFPISVQDADSYFTRRPTEMWIEITPTTKNGAKNETEPLPTYIFYDRNYTLGTPVPVETWTADRWPAGSAQAKVQVWCKYSPTEPGGATPLREIVEDRARFLTGTPIALVDGATFRVQLPERIDGDTPYEIKIIEEHGPASPGVGALKVLLETEKSLLPKRIVRRFDAKHRVAIHSYWFDPDTARKVLDSAASRITFTTRNATRDGAWRIENRSLTVDIFGAGETLPLDAATGVR
ncbi:MAG: VWA domain-containing protein [Planctomycetia bacterium]|nr:VWA domain-containing protein [Planctomycetia bacterium]